MIFRAKTAKLIDLIWLNSNKKVAKLVSKTKLSYLITNLATLATRIGGVLTLYSGSSSTRRPPLTPFAPWAVSLLPTKQDSHRPLQLSETQMSETRKSEAQMSETQMFETQMSETQMSETQMSGTQMSETLKSESKARRFFGWFECRPMSEQRFHCHCYSAEI